MLRLIIPEDEWWDEKNEKFVLLPEVKLDLEHSLISVSKWESIYQKPFLSAGEKTPIEIFGYLKAMIVSPNTDLDVLHRCSQSSIDEIQKYIDSPQTATTFSQMPEHRGPGETITSELIYYWMTAATIPWEAQYWHLNRLLTLIRISSIKNSKPKKLSKHEIAMRNREENARRRAASGSRG